MFWNFDLSAVWICLFSLFYFRVCEKVFAVQFAWHRMKRKCFQMELICLDVDGKLFGMKFAQMSIFDVLLCAVYCVHFARSVHTIHSLKVKAINHFFLSFLSPPLTIYIVGVRTEKKTSLMCEYLLRWQSKSSFVQLLVFFYHSCKQTNKQFMLRIAQSLNQTINKHSSIRFIKSKIALSREQTTKAKTKTKINRIACNCFACYMPIFILIPIFW